MDQCHSYEGIESWAFYCEGVKITLSKQISAQPVVSVPKQISAQPAVSVPRLGYYNLNACRGDEDSKIHKGYITPTKPDTCNIRFRYPWKLSIAHPAICANGKKASLAVFKDQLCNSQPFIFPVSDDKLNQCLTFDFMGSWAFWCDGEGLGGSTSRLPISKPHFMDVKKVSTGESITIPKIELHVQELPQGATIGRPRKADAPHLTRPALVGVPSFAVATAAPPETHLGSNRFGPIHITSIPRNSEASIAIVVGFLVIASLLVLIGIWLWFGDLILHALHVLFPWPFKSSVNGEIVLGEDKV